MIKYTQDGSYETPDRKMTQDALYEVEIFNDGELTRERGKVNFEKLSNQDLCYVLEVAIGGYLRDEVNDDTPILYNKFDNGVDCNKFTKLLSYNLKLDSSNRKMILNTLRKHIDYIGYEDYASPAGNVDHNQVGTYLVLFKDEISKSLYDSYYELFKHRVAELKRNNKDSEDKQNRTF